MVGWWDLKFMDVDHHVTAPLGVGLNFYFFADRGSVDVDSGERARLVVEGNRKGIEGFWWWRGSGLKGGGGGRMRHEWYALLLCGCCIFSL